MNLKIDSVFSTNILENLEFSYTTINFYFFCFNQFIMNWNWAPTLLKFKYIDLFLQPFEAFSNNVILFCSIKPNFRFIPLLMSQFIIDFNEWLSLVGFHYLFCPILLGSFGVQSFLAHFTIKISMCLSYLFYPYILFYFFKVVFWGFKFHFGKSNFIPSNPLFMFHYLHFSPEK